MKPLTRPLPRLTRRFKKIHTLAVREKVVDIIRRTARTNAKRLAEMAVDETGMGRIEDKIKKNLLVADRTPGPEALSPAAISGDTGLTLIENAPWGVIASNYAVHQPGGHGNQQRQSACFPAETPWFLGLTPQPSELPRKPLRH